MTEKLKRSYPLPAKLADDLNAECARSGLVRERVIAAAIYAFLESDPNRRSEMFERLKESVGPTVRRKK